MSVLLVAPTSTRELVAAALRGLPHECVLGADPAGPAVGPQTVVKGDRAWRVGSQHDVAWIRDRTSPGRAITSTLPSAFDAYATVVIPDDDAERRAGESALLQLLTAHTSTQPWWLGYLDTGAHDVVFDEAWKVVLYTGGSYVLGEAGPTEAGTWRPDDAWRGRLPDLVFPADHTWLMSMLWDDDWRCLGGPDELVSAVLTEPGLEAYPVRAGEDATPPGHVAR